MIHESSNPTVAQAEAVVAEPDRFQLPVAETVMASGAVKPRLARPRPPRDGWLRSALFCTLLGAVLAVVYAWVWSSPSAVAAGSPSWPQIWILLLALGAVVGVVALDRAVMAGMLLMLVTTGLGWAHGTAWLMPGTFLGCVWAVRHSSGARAMLGLFFLLPGVAAGFYGLFAFVSLKSELNLGFLPMALDPPAGLQQALQPFWLLPLALLGAWMLIPRER